MALRDSLVKYRAAAEGFESGHVAFEALVDVGLEPFISGQGVADASDDQLELLGKSGPGGRVVAALILVATEPGLGSTPKEYRSMLVEGFRPMLLACRDRPWDAVVRLDPDTMLSQAYLRQALILVALLYDNEDVANNLITLGFPPRRCLFAMLARDATRDEWKYSDRVLCSLIAHGWLSPNVPAFLERVFLAQEESATQLIDMLYDARGTSPALEAMLAENQDAWLDAVASRGSPRTLDHLLRKLGRRETPPPFLVPASTREGSQGSLAMLRYLIDERGMDVDWIKLVVDPADAHNPYLDMRERGFPQLQPDSTTALHGAAHHGDIDAIKYLLNKGAKARVADGKGLYASSAAADAGHDRAAAILRSYAMYGNSGSWRKY